jgi:hypothetical protein
MFYRLTRIRRVQECEEALRLPPTPKDEARQEALRIEEREERTAPSIVWGD